MQHHEAVMEGPVRGPARPYARLLQGQEGKPAGQNLRKVTAAWLGRVSPEVWILSRGNGLCRGKNDKGSRVRKLRESDRETRVAQTGSGG